MFSLEIQPYLSEFVSNTQNFYEELEQLARKNIEVTDDPSQMKIT